MNIPNINSSGTGISIPSNVQWAIGVDGVYTKIIPSAYRPRVVYRLGDGTVHPEGWENIDGNKYLDFYLPAYQNMTDIDLNDLANYVYKDSLTGSAYLPSGTTSERSDSPISGMVRFNTELNRMEMYDLDGWREVGGGQFTGSLEDTKPLIYTSKVVTEDTTIPNGQNVLAIDSITIEDGVTLILEDQVIMKVV